MKKKKSGSKNKSRRGRKDKVNEVGCAIIENKGKLLIAQRLPGQFLGGYWEFPGGKRHDQESMAACLTREIREELGIEIRVLKFLFQMYHEYPGKRVLLDFYLCRWVSGEPARLECLNFAWVPVLDLKKYNFVPADTAVINELTEKRFYYFGGI